MTRYGRLLRPVLLITPMIVSSCFLLPREEELLAPPLAEPPVITYRTETVSRGTIQDTIRAFGTFVSAAQSDLSFERRGGRLRTVHVSIGEEVGAGELLAELYTDQLESEIAQAELDLRRAEVALRRAREQATDRFAVAFARADRDLAQARLDGLQIELDRELQLTEVTGVQGDAVRSLRRQIAEQEIVLGMAKLSLEQIVERDDATAVELAEIDVEAVQTRLRTLRDQLRATRLVAPISGVVTWISRQAQEGDTVQAFQRLIRIANPGDLVFEYQGRDSNRFDVGMPSIISVRNEEFRGTVILTPRSVPFDQREEYEDTVHIRVDEPIPDLRLGTSGTAQLVLAERENVLVLPKRAVQRFTTRRYVHVLVNGVRVERDVEVGLETATEVEIVRGLDEGEEVVLR